VRKHWGHARLPFLIVLDLSGVAILRESIVAEILNPSSSLLQGVRDGSAESWRRLVRVYAPIVAQFCLRRGLRLPEAEDVVQDVFFTIFRGIAAFQPVGDNAFVRWLYAATQRRLLDHRRRLAGEPVATGGSDFRNQLEAVPQPENEDEFSYRLDALREVLAQVEAEVEARTWQAFCRLVLDGQDTAQVAVELGMTSGHLRVAKCRVLQRIRDLLQ
jgi:RNA polymerase sigma factor (sigma-70 family)